MAYLTFSNGSIFEGRRIQLLIYPKRVFALCEIFFNGVLHTFRSFSSEFPRQGFFTWKSRLRGSGFAFIHRSVLPEWFHLPSAGCRSSGQSRPINPLLSTLHWRLLSGLSVGWIVPFAIGWSGQFLPGTHKAYRIESGGWTGRGDAPGDNSGAYGYSVQWSDRGLQEVPSWGSIQRDFDRLNPLNHILAKG